MQMLDLCAGIGGASLAASWAGINTVAFAEIDEFCSRVLRKHWPDTPNLGDVLNVSKSSLANAGVNANDIQLITAGIPCQPYSIAGRKRAEKDNRAIWPEVLRIIEEVKPYYVCIENVTGFISLALDLVQTDLESAGYTTQAYVLPACAVGAPHTRERVFVVAHASSRGWGTWGTQLTGQQRPLFTDGKSPSCMADSRCPGCEQWAYQSKSQPECLGTSDTRDDGSQGCMAHANRQRQQECDLAAGSRASGLVTGSTDAGRDRAYGQSQPRMGREFNGLSSWLDSPRWPSAPNQPQEEWEPPRTIPHKLKHRASRLKALGNAVVPQQVYPILKAIVDIEQAYEVMSA